MSRWDVVEVRTQSHRQHRHGLPKYPAGPDALPPYELYRWTEAPSSRRVSNRPARSEAFASSYCHRASPKLNGAVERAQRTHTEEFYEVNDFPLEIAPLNPATPPLGAYL